MARLLVIALLVMFVVYWVRRLSTAALNQRAPARGSRKPDVLLPEAEAPGGSPQSARPFKSHRSAHQNAKSEPCRSCGAAVAVQDAFDDQIEGRAFHIVNVVCRECGARARVYFGHG